jgi:hypothetical protein
MEPDFETYAHEHQLPQTGQASPFDDRWQPVLDTLRGNQFL